MQGPLAGVKVIEFAGIGPGPFCGMLLADLGADVVRIDRKGASGSRNAYERGRRSVALDLKKSEAVEVCLRLAERADMLFEGFRPGVMERLGLGPDVALKRNPKLIYGRMTGWGQTGPLAHAAGHDINYISITGALSAIGMPDRPIPPLNLVGDFGGGSLFLAFGMVSALLLARQSGRGQVVDCAITEGAASLMTFLYTLHQSGIASMARRENFLDGGAPFYNTYKCADGKWVSVGPIEPHFYTVLLDKAQIADPDLQNPYDKARWPEQRQKLEAIFARKSRDEWCALLEGTDACFAPILDITEAPHHPHNIARGSYIEVDGLMQPGPAPKFSETPGAVQRGAPNVGEHTEAALREWGLSAGEVEALIKSGAA